MSDFDGKYEFNDNPPRSAAIFNRSLTIHSSANEFTHKPYNHLYNPAIERSGSIKKLQNNISSFESVKGKVRKLCSLFESPKPTNNSVNLPSIEQSGSSLLKATPKSAPLSSVKAPSIRLPGTEDRVVVYFTSLRGVRRTFEDCYSVRMILRGFRVFVDERDISMDSAYRKELQSVLGEKKNVSLPQVFIRGEYVGGADAIRQLHEIGELAKTLKGLPFRKPGYVCETCGDARFVPCVNCSGSRKVFDEDDEQLKRCPECNENGLIRCPTCCCS